jgi:hypothetical protein
MQAQSGLLHRKDRVQHILQQPKMRLGLAEEDPRRESLFDAFPDPGPGGDPRERT